MLPDTQNGFRRKRSTTDNIFILNHCARKVLKNGNQLYSCFVDLKAAFDTVNRQKLFKRMRKLKIPEYLVCAIEEIYRNTRYCIGETKFQTDTGLRQGCPLIPQTRARSSPYEILRECVDENEDLNVEREGSFNRLGFSSSWLSLMAERGQESAAAEQVKQRVTDQSLQARSRALSGPHIREHSGVQWIAVYKRRGAQPHGK